MPGNRDRSDSADEYRARAGQQQAARRLRRFVGHRRGSAEVTDIGADDAMSGFDHRKSRARDRVAQGDEIGEPVEHLLLDLDVVGRARERGQRRS